MARSRLPQLVASYAPWFASGGLLLTMLIVACSGAASEPSNSQNPGNGDPPTMYFNSAEPGCGTDPSIVLCDDFESGSWYTKDCDQANASGGLLQTKGWCGTIYSNPI